MTEREKMLAGQLYDCGDPELLAQWHRAKDLMRDYDRTNSADLAEKERILGELLGGRGKNLWITAPFYVDYGNNIYFGDNCEISMNCTFSVSPGRTDPSPSAGPRPPRSSSVIVCGSAEGLSSCLASP